MMGNGGLCTKKEDHYLTLNRLICSVYTFVFHKMLRRHNRFTAADQASCRSDCAQRPGQSADARFPPWTSCWRECVAIDGGRGRPGPAPARGPRPGRCSHQTSSPRPQAGDRGASRRQTANRQPVRCSDGSAARRWKPPPHSRPRHQSCSACCQSQRRCHQVRRSHQVANQVRCHREASRG